MLSNFSFGVFRLEKQFEENWAGLPGWDLGPLMNSGRNDEVSDTSGAEQRTAAGAIQILSDRPILGLNGSLC